MIRSWGERGRVKSCCMFIITTVMCSLRHWEPDYLQLTAWFGTGLSYESLGFQEILGRICHFCSLLVSTVCTALLLAFFYQKVKKVLLLYRLTDRQVCNFALQEALHRIRYGDGRLLWPSMTDCSTRSFLSIPSFFHGSQSELWILGRRERAKEKAGSKLKKGGKEQRKEQRNRRVSGAELRMNTDCLYY